jgi:hypothetical protein
VRQESRPAHLANEIPDRKRIRELLSLIPDQNSLFRFLGNCAKKRSGHVGFSARSAQNRLKSSKFPVYSLMIREYEAREWFAADCVIRQPVFSFRDSLLLCAKNPQLARIRHSRSTGELLSVRLNASFGDFSLFALWAVDLACRWAWVRPPTAERGRLRFSTASESMAAGRPLDRAVPRPAAQIRGHAFAPPSPPEYRNGRSVMLAR